MKDNLAMNALSLFKLFLVFGIILTALPVFAGEMAESIIKEGNFFGEARYRYEFVDQSGIAEKATASTIRTNLGFKTGEYRNFQALIEAQLVNTLGANSFNDTTNDKTTHPIVADPDVTELNELWLSYAGLPDTAFKIGRQKINIDNQRFVGTVGWRQNDQTFDSAKITNSSLPNLDLVYVHIANINRIQGNDHPLGDLDTETHIAHANYKVADWLEITGYGYWIDIDLAAALSNKTYGVRLTGNAPINDSWTFFYEAETATQNDHGDNPNNYNEKYYHISPGIKSHGFTIQAGYETLGGNGATSFQTPLATGHKFNGWADAFLMTPAAGLEDAYVSASYNVSDTGSPFDGTKLTAVYHDFDSNDASRSDFGDELDLSISKSFTLPDAGQPFKKVTVLMKYANYDGNSSIANREKFWLQIGVKF